MLAITGSHPKQQPALVQLRLQVVGMVVVDQLGERRAGQAAGPAGHRRGEEGARERAARRHHRSAGDDRADVHEPADQGALRIADRFERDVGRARHPRVVLELRDLAVAVAELVLDGALRGEQAQLAPVEAGAEQLVDRRLQGIWIMKYADRLPKGGGRANCRLRTVHRLLSG